MPRYHWPYSLQPCLSRYAFSSSALGACSLQSSRSSITVCFLRARLLAWSKAALFISTVIVVNSFPLRTRLKCPVALSGNTSRRGHGRLQPLGQDATAVGEPGRIEYFEPMSQ